MIGGGTEVIVGVADDRLFGPLVVFGSAEWPPKCSPTTWPGSRR